MLNILSRLLIRLITIFYSIILLEKTLLIRFTLKKQLLSEVKMSVLSDTDYFTDSISLEPQLLNADIVKNNQLH